MKTLASCIAALSTLAPEGAPALVKDVCAAVHGASSDVMERALLVVTASDESALKASIVDCRWRGDRGKARGAWQVHARSPRERKALCSVATAAPIALARLRESIELCGSWPAPQRLAGYASGRCSSKAGRRISERRWSAALRLVTDET